MNKMLLRFCTLVAAIIIQGRCASEKHPLLNIATLYRTERIIISKTGYMLLETLRNPEYEDSGRQLLLFDISGKFLGEIPLFGSVLKTGKDKIIISQTNYNEFKNPGNKIGFLRISYEHFPSRGKIMSGGNAGTFLVDSLTVVSAHNSVKLFMKKPVRQFVTTPYQFSLDESKLVVPTEMTVSLKNMRFEHNKTANKYFTVTVYNSEFTGTSTTAFYFANDQVRDRFFEQIIKIRL